MKISLPNISSIQSLVTYIQSWERLALKLFSVVAFAALLVLLVFQIGAQNLEPTTGGLYKEGMVGTVRYLNPILASINENDRTLVPLLFSGLMRYDKQGNLVPDLAESFAIGEFGKVYDFELRDDAMWQDGYRVTPDDIVFTIKRIQNPDYQSPLRFGWEGVTVEKVDDHTVRFTLVDPYSLFLENTTVGIIPQHVWENIDPLTFPLADLNLKPIGSGPYVLDAITRRADGIIDAMTMVRNTEYRGTGPYLDRLEFHFYDTDESLFDALNRGEVEGVGGILPDQFLSFAPERASKQEILLPRYFALFFNKETNTMLANANIRTALAQSIDKQQLIQQVFRGEAKPVDSPIPEATRYYNPNLPAVAFDPATAETLFASYATPPAFTITTLKDPDLLAAASFIRQAWEAVGASVTIETRNPIELRDEVIKNREFQILLFGQSLKRNPDPFSFWHSSQIKEPGLNLSQYSNSEVDRLLEDSRQIFDDSVRQQKLENFQELLTNDMPAIFLYSPYYLYIIDKKIKGVDMTALSSADERFYFLPYWYINVRRTF
ncbi:MAG: hypothetical protein A2666_05085 [Parcubacteria group bacterium RIFCSPHIGHO2_01_FULL_47_10b]|nr:MAG: hypothetical protein A2666_05085 [Parcubacteria group bacterium RIFCSPHIGHO2_01_FULL_47_10b]